MKKIGLTAEAFNEIQRIAKVIKPDRYEIRKEFNEIQVRQATDKKIEFWICDKYAVACVAVDDRRDDHLREIEFISGEIPRIDIKAKKDSVVTLEFDPLMVRIAFTTTNGISFDQIFLPNDIYRCCFKDLYEKIFKQFAGEITTMIIKNSELQKVAKVFTAKEMFSMTLDETGIIYRSYRSTNGISKQVGILRTRYERKE